MWKYFPIFKNILEKGHKLNIWATKGVTSGNNQVITFVQEKSLVCKRPQTADKITLWALKSCLAFLWHQL